MVGSWVRVFPAQRTQQVGDGVSIHCLLTMTTEIRNWAVVAAAMEAQGATNSFMYKRAKAIAEGQPDPMPTSFPAAPLSISAA